MVHALYSKGKIGEGVWQLTLPLSIFSPPSPIRALSLHKNHAILLVMWAHAACEIVLTLIRWLSEPVVVASSPK
jgi:hypothetical protein